MNNAHEQRVSLNAGGNIYYKYEVYKCNYKQKRLEAGQTTAHILQQPHYSTPHYTHTDCISLTLAAPKSNAFSLHSLSSVRIHSVQ